MNEETQQKFMDFGALLYPESRMISILGLSKKQFSDLWAEGSIYYGRGQNNFEFQIDRKLMQLAMNGDMKAMDKIDAKKRSMPKR